MRYMNFVLIAAFAATACIDKANDRSDIIAERAGQDRFVKLSKVTVGSTTSTAEVGEQVGDLDLSPSTPSSTAVTRDPAPLSLTMPAKIRGKWRRWTEANVAPAECVDSASPNIGLILTITSDGFSRFEDGGSLIRVHERGPSQIRATFDSTYADTPTQDELLFETQDNDQTLLEQQYGDGAQPGILRYRRCPAADQKQ